MALDKADLNQITEYIKENIAEWYISYMARVEKTKDKSRGILYPTQGQGKQECNPLSPPFRKGRLGKGKNWILKSGRSSEWQGGRQSEFM